MKASLFRTIGLAGIFAAGNAQSETAETNIETINARIAENQKKSANAIITHAQKIEDTVEVAVHKESLFARTSVLTDGQLSVFIPKGAVVTLAGQNRLSEGSRILGKLVEWEEFLRANRAVIELIEVPGNKLYEPEPIEPSVMEKIQKNKLIGVTTYQARPVALKNSLKLLPKLVVP